MSLRRLTATLFVAAVANLFISCTAQSGNLKGPDAGNWTVGECILAQFAMEFTVHYDNSNQNKTIVVDVPTDAKIDDAKSLCGLAQQTLTLLWSEPASNDSKVILNRTLTVEFSVVPNDTYYGVSRFYGVFDLASWEEVNELNETSVNTSQVSVDSGENAKLMFHTPLDRSYLCADLGHIELPTTLKYLEGPPSGTQLTNSTVVAKNVKFDAFRTKDKAPPGYRTPMDCDYRPNDIVPIAVGVALALLVVTVLISYLVGRRRHRQRGYQSV